MSGGSRGSCGPVSRAGFTPQFPVELIEKDFGDAVEVAGSPEAAPTIAAARGVFRQAIAQGFGSGNMTGVVRMFAKPDSR